MNAYIPSLAQDSPEVVRIFDKLQTFEGEPELEDPNMSIDNSSSTPLLSNDGSPQENGETTKKLKLLEAEYQTELSRATSRISSFGIALGYGAGICLLIVALIPVTQLHGSTFSLRLAIGLSGIWWAVFTIPAAVWLPGSSAYRRQVHLTAPSSQDNNGIPGRGEWNLWKEIIAAWIRLGNMLRWTEIKKLGNTFKYLAAWFLLSDGPLNSNILILTLLLKYKCRFHNHHFYCHPVWENHTTHVTFSSHPCGSPHSDIWGSRITRLAHLTTSLRLDESPSTRVVTYLGIYDPCLWLFGVLLPRTNKVWRVDYTRGDVWIGGLFRLVVFY
jgi:Vacuole effluxer Atg22 like